MARTPPGVAVEAHSGKAVSCRDAADVKMYGASKHSAKVWAARQNVGCIKMHVTSKCVARKTAQCVKVFRASKCAACKIAPCVKMDGVSKCTMHQNAQRV